MTDTPDQLAQLIVAAYNHGIETACLSDDLSASSQAQKRAEAAEKRAQEAQEALAAEVAANERLQAETTAAKAESECLLRECERLQSQLEQATANHQRVWMQNEAAQRELATLRAGTVCGVTHFLLNDLSMVANLPGSPTYEACVRSIIEELPRLRRGAEWSAGHIQLLEGMAATELEHAEAESADIALGRLVRQMPLGFSLVNDAAHPHTFPWECRTPDGDRFAHNLPEDALKAAGIGTGDDGDGDKAQP